MTCTKWLTPFIRRWERCQNQKEMLLLRLSILRDLFHFIHADKSSCFVNGDRDKLSHLNLLSDRIIANRTALDLNFSLQDLLTGQAQSSRHLKSPPFPHFKLERADRQWEKALFIQALKLKWDFYSLEASVSIRSVEKWKKKLELKLRPHGMVLFAESASEKNTSPSMWQGKWYCLLKKRRLPKKYNWKLLLKGAE